MKIAGLLLSSLLCSSTLGYAQTRSTLDGVYTKAQAKLGGEVYKQQCLVCHDKKYFKPVLKRWNGQTAAVLFDVMSGSMPESNPGGLQEQEYLNLLAYIFSRSRYPSGETPLIYDALSQITIQDP